MPSQPPATPRKRPQQERSQVTVQAILTAAAHILTEAGYDHFTTNKVAERAGVSIGSLYQYFPNKASLLLALAEHHADQMMQLAKDHLETTGDRSIPEVIRQIVAAAVAAHAVNPKLHLVLHEQVPHSEVMRQFDQAKMENLLRSFLVQQCDQLQPKNLDLTVFMVERTIRALIHGAMTEHPEFLQTGELDQELTALLSAYLLKK
ncbi:MAG: TetR/AcrR family transcriptional regulator [Leptolyngbyaceae cyanobacterium SM1_4_3]|nr:TetR/AcrR family transcriptional regulator [Leptolyngbyaceae cyanobacterium SM1_4_3]